MTDFLANLGRLLLLALGYVVLFTIGTLFVPPVEQSEDLRLQAVEALLIVALVDSALVLAVVRTSRLHGVKLILLVAGVFYVVKTVSSQIEALYFVPNVTGPMLPWLLTMTVPLALGLAPLAVWVGGRLRGGPLDEAPGWVPLPMGEDQAWVKGALLSAAVYPVLFFAAGWFIAFRSPEVRTFYGGVHGSDVLSHYAWVFSHDPLLYPLEVGRGALWVAAALPLLRTTRGAWWVGALHVALWFSLVQNDVQLMPNHLMTPELRLHHFMEAAASNFAFAWVIGWLLSRSHAPHPFAHGPMAPA